MTRTETHRRAQRRTWCAAAFGLFLCLPPIAAAQSPVTVPQVLRLADAIRIALETSTQVGSDAAQLDASRKARTAALFAFGPDVRLGADYSAATRTEYDVPFVRPDSTVGTRDEDEESDFRQYSAVTGIRLFDGFANVARFSAARHDVRADEHALAYTRHTVQENVVSAYYNLARAKLLLKVAEEAESVAREQLERTQALYELGSAARSDVLKSQVQHGNTRLELVRARNNERQAHVDLEFTMNLTTPATFEIDTTVTRIPDAAVDFAAERERALSDRENLVSLRHRETASNRRVWAARGALLPTLDFQYSVSQTRSTSQFRFGAAENFNRSWGFSANWNVWDRYQNYANIAQARASARQAEYARRQGELDAIREVQQLVNSLGEARERLAVARENVARSREDLRLAQEKFRVGAGTILDTITAESDLTATRASEVQAVVDFLIARANLARATGRDFSEL